MRDILTGFAFFLVFEGLVYALAPSFIKSLARQLPQVPEDRLRIMGVAAIAIGTVLVWLIRRH